MSRPYVETFSGSHQSSMGSRSPYLPFISKVTFVVCPAFTSTSLSCLPSVSCQTSIFCLPAGTFSSLAAPLASVTAATPGTTATQPSIHEWTSQVSLMISGFSNFSVIVFLNFGCALLMAGFAVEYVWMLCRMSSEFLSSSSPGVITVTSGLILQPFWSTTPLTALVPLAFGAEATALASPLLEPTTTFSMVVSVPHFSVSLLTLSFSTTGAPLYFTSTSTVPPPCAPASRGPITNIAALATSAIAVSATNVLRMDRPPAFLLLDCAAPRRAHDQPQHREREKSDSGRNEEPAIRLRFLQPQIVPRCQRHPGPRLPRSAVPRLERDGREDARPEARSLGPGGDQRALHHQRVLTVLEHRLARGLAALDRRQLRRAVRAQLHDAPALLPAQQVHAVGGVAHQEVRPLRPRRLLRRELQRDRVGERRLAVALVLGGVVPRQVKRDLLVVVDGAHADQIDRGIEVARVDDHLALEQDVVRRELLPERSARIVGNRLSHRGHRHQRGRLRRVGAERDDVVGQVPDVLGLLHRFEKGGHRRAEHAVGQPRGDLGARAATTEVPALGQVGRRDRLAPLVLQLRTRRPVAAALGAVALVAFDRLEHLLAALDRGLGGRDLLRQLELLRRLLESLGRERLEVRHEVVPVLVGKNRPRGHGGPGHPVGDDAEEVLIARRLVRGRPDLVETLREVARLRHQQLGGRSLAVPLLAVTEQALPLVHGLARVGILREGGSRAREQQQRGDDPNARHARWPPTVAAAARWPRRHR